jgi:hypothetical protein
MMLSKILKTLWATIIAVIVMTSGVSAQQKWDCGETPGTVTCALDDNGVFTVSGVGNMTFYSTNNIPWYEFRNSINSVVINIGVTSIGNHAFYECTGATSVTIPNSVTEIGWAAFSRCSSLTSVAIPNSVTYIGTGAFANCSGLTSVTIPNTITSIENNTFAGSGLTSVTIPNSVTSIGPRAFEGCTGLTSVTIGSSVTSIGCSVYFNT